MSVWDSIVGQQRVVEQLKAIASGDPKAIAQSWLICGPPGSGRSNVARAFAAALESPDHGLGDEPTKAVQQVLAGTHPDVTVLATNKVTIGIDEVRDIITTSEQMPSTARTRFGSCARRVRRMCCRRFARALASSILLCLPRRQWPHFWNKMADLSRKSRYVPHALQKGISALRACMRRMSR